MFKKMGPGVLVAAAFVGPGTVTVCTMAGVEFGYSLLWAMVLSILATMVLQEMTARLGIITQKGLAQVIKGEIGHNFLRHLAIGVLLGAIVLGNAAYEAGNIGGAVLGLEALFGKAGTDYYPFIIGGFSFTLLYLGNYRILEKIFVLLVGIMGFSFIITAVLTEPPLFALLQGMFLPFLPNDGVLAVIALVGTTVVPYNLFLHASLVQEKWKSKEALPLAQKDTYRSVLVGGLVSMSIIIGAAGISGASVTNVMDLARGLEPLYGKAARYGLGIGLFAAGVTSAITAPLAAAYVASSCLNWKAHLKDSRFRAVWMVILALGVIFMSFGIRPLEVIRFAQIANGVLLPFTAIFLLWAANRKSIMGRHRNTIYQNLFGYIILLMTLVLGIKSVLMVLNDWF